jgi:hypothetical protein
MIAAFWDWVDSRSVVRRLVLFITLWMTWLAFQWAADFALVVIDKSGIEAAAIIAAVTAPISVLQGYVFKVYAEGRKG